MAGLCLVIIYVYILFLSYYYHEHASVINISAVHSCHPLEQYLSTSLPNDGTLFGLSYQDCLKHECSI